MRALRDCGEDVAEAIAQRCNCSAAPHLAAIRLAHVDGLRIASLLTAICGAAEQLPFFLLPPCNSSMPFCMLNY